MSTIKADNWQPSAGGTSVDIDGGLCKAWCDFNGESTAAILTSYNVSSLTDNGTGLYRLTHTNDMSVADYGIQVSSSFDASYTINACVDNRTPATVSTQNYSCHQSNTTSLIDAERVFTNISGSLA